MLKLPSFVGNSASELAVQSTNKIIQLVSKEHEDPKRNRTAKQKVSKLERTREAGKMTMVGDYSLIIINFETVMTILSV